MYRTGEGKMFEESTEQVRSKKRRNIKQDRRREGHGTDN